MYNFTCPQCSSDLMVKDWGYRYTTGTREPWCFCPRCKYKCYAQEDLSSEDKDRLVGDMTWKYIDRMSNPTPEDSAEKILEEFVEEWYHIWFGDKH